MTNYASQERTRNELTNALLALALMHHVKAEEFVGDRLSVTKEIFAATYKLQSLGVRAFSLNFYRYRHGAFTDELFPVWEAIEDAGCRQPSSSSDAMRLTAKGTRWAERILEYLRQSIQTELLAVFEEVAGDFRPLRGTTAILQFHYSTIVRPLGWSEEVALRDVPLRVPLTRALSPQEAKRECLLPDALLQEFDLERLIGAEPDKPTQDALRLHLANPLVREAIEAGVAAQGERVRLTKADLVRKADDLRRTTQGL